MKKIPVISLTNLDIYTRTVLQARTWLSDKKLVLGYVFGICLFASGLHHSEFIWAGVALVISISLIMLLFAIRNKSINIGKKEVWIPLLVIVASILIAPGQTDSKIFGVFIIPIYLAGIHLGDRAFKPMAILTCVGAVSVIVFGFTSDWERLGGIYNSHAVSGARNIATGMIVMGIVVSPQWWVTCIGTAGLAATGAEEALFVGGCLILLGLITRNWRRVLPVILIICLGLAIVTPLGITAKIYSKADMRIDAAIDIVTGDISEENLNIATHDRYGTIVKTFRMYGFRFFGTGYNPYNVSYYSLHNVPLRVLFEIGFLAAIAWLWLLGYKILKLKGPLRTVWIAVGLMSIFDHFMWTSLGIWFWYLLGVPEYET
ncbi:hypothetical protein ACFLXA_03430 [Chloroflexota bacterium]